MIIKKICLILLKIYKRTLSPFIGRNCPYTPTCSMYAYEAIDKHGVVVGGVKAAYRLLRCNPFNKGGFDPCSENYRGNVRWLI